MQRATLPKKQRLVKNDQFKAVLKGRRCRSDDVLLVYVCENRLGYPRFGISVGRAVGPAVVRNRLKRMLREACRLAQYDIPGDRDYLLMMSRQWSKKKLDAPDPASATKRLKTEHICRSLLRLVGSF